MKDRFKAILTEGPIGPLLFKMTIPMIWGMLAMMVFNIADTYFVAKLGTIPLAAMGFTFPVVLSVAHIALGLGIGASSVISRAIGEGDHDQVLRLTTDSLLLSLCLVGITLIIGYYTIDPLFKMMGASAETLNSIRPYMKIWYAGTIFLVIPMVGNHAIRASGDTFLPGMVMLTGSLFNVILDPILIFGLYGFPAMGIAGAALATVIARAIICAMSLWILLVNKKMISSHIPGIKKVFSSWKRISQIGIPSTIAMMLPTIAIGVLTWMVSDYGQNAVAGFGVAGKVEGLALTIFMALSTVFGPFVGQNWGAGNINRVRKAFTKSINFSLVFGCFQAILLIIFAENIVSAFNRDAEVMRVAVTYLRIIPFSYGIVSIVYLASSAFNALGKPMFPIRLMIIRLVILHIPCAFLGKEIFGLVGFISATHIATFITAYFAISWMRKTCLMRESNQ